MKKSTTDGPLNPPLHRGAFHEAGHAVIARLLQVPVVRIRIDPVDPTASARAWIGQTCPHNVVRIAAAGDACLRAFGYVTINSHGGLSDEVAIGNALEELSDDEDSHPQHRREAIAEVERWFEQPKVRAAVVALVSALMGTGEVGGAEAMAIIDRHLV